MTQSDRLLRWVGFTAALVILGAALSACGGDDGGQATTPPTAVVQQDDLPTDEPVEQATEDDEEEATEGPTAIPTTPAPTSGPRPQTSAGTPSGGLPVEFIYDEITLAVLNPNRQAVSLTGMSFSSASGDWEASEWGNNAERTLRPNSCLRLRDENVTTAQPPPQCTNTVAVARVPAADMFWVGVETFDVLINGEVVATCESAAGRCTVTLP